MQINAYVLSLAGAGIFSALLAIHILARPARGSTELACLMIAVSEWALAITLEASVTTLPGKLYWSAVAYLGTTTAPAFYFLFVLRHTQQDGRLPPVMVPWLFVVPLASVVIAATNSWHGLLWSRVTLVETWGGTTALYERGPWFWVQIFHSYLLLALSVVLLLWAIMRLPQLFSRQSRLLLAASCAPLAGSAIYLLSPRTVAGIDPTPISFVATGLLLSIAIRRYRLLDLTPLAREALFENLDAAVLFLDAQERMVDLNPAARQALKLSEQDIGRPALALSPVWPQIADLLQARASLRVEALIGGQEQRPYEVRRTFLHDKRGNVIGQIITLHDVSERKEAEQQLLAMERRMQQAQRLESLAVLAGGLAQDFNNLLAAILGNLELAALDIPAASRARANLDEAAHAAQRAADLTRQMVAYAGKGQYVIKAVDLNDLIKRRALLLRASVAESVTLDLELAPALPPVLADPDQIEQVIMNLVSNGAEAIAGEGEISLATGVQDCSDEDLQQSRLDEKPAPGRFVYLQVTDTGCGMDEQVQQRLFEPFFSTKFVGRGLGMAAVLGIVRAHRGAILLRSEPGGGTAVRVLLPAYEEEQAGRAGDSS